MARNAGDVLVKRNSKLESFLKKNLDDDTFHRIRCHEACIVCSDTEDKAYKFVVLTDDWIYLTENPPKKVQPIVHLGDVLSVELVNKFPDFLSGEERDSCQHVVIKYLTQSEKSKKKQEKEEKAQNGSVTSRSGNVTSRTARPGSATSRSGFMSARNTVLARGKAQSLKEHGSPKVTAQPRQHSIDAEVWRDVLHETDDSQSQSPRSPKLKKGKKSKGKKTRGTDSDTQSVTSNLATTLRNRYSSSDYDRVRARNRPLPNPADEWDENGDLTDKRRKEPLKLSYSQTGELHLSLDQLDDDASECSGKENEDVFNETSRTNETARSTPKKKQREKRGLFAGLRSKRKSDGIKEKDEQSTSSTSSKIEEEQEDEDGQSELEDELRRTTLNLYILNYSSPVLMLTRTAWNNYLIRGTLLLDEDYEKKTISLFSPRTSSEKLHILFSQLTGELMNSENTMEDTFSLLHELKVATERNQALKTMFWKKTDVFLFLIRQMQLYLPTPKEALSSKYEAAKAERADQLDFVNLILEIIALMLRETEVLPTRLQCLKTGKGKSMLDVIVMLTCTPWLPQQPDQPDDGAKKNTNTSSNNHANQIMTSSSYVELWTSLTDIDLKQLLEELTDHSTTVLYELILIAHQANWGDTNGSFLNICWLIKVLDELNTTESFVARLVNQTLRHILPTARREELTPEEAVLVFMQFSVIQTMVEYSPQIAAFIRNNFHEEFKYYIQAPIILQKLPPYYPIAPYTIRLMEEVMSDILERRISLRLEHHYDQLF